MTFWKILSPRQESQSDKEVPDEKPIFRSIISTICTKISFGAKVRHKIWTFRILQKFGTTKFRTKENRNFEMFKYVKFYKNL